MIARKRVFLMLTVALLLLVWQRAESARFNGKGRKVDAFSTAPYNEYLKWRKHYLRGNGEEIPHYALATVARRKTQTSATMQIAAIGEMIGGYRLEVQPIIIQRNPGGPSQRLPLGVSTLFTFGLDNDERGNVSLIQPYLIIPLEPGSNGIEMKWSLRAENETEDRVLTMILPLEIRDSDQTITFGFVDGEKLQAARIKGMEKGISAESFDMGPGTCYPGCNFVSIFGGPSGCNVWKCCLDKWPITDPSTCEIYCWSECWNAPN